MKGQNKTVGFGRYLTSKKPKPDAETKMFAGTVLATAVSSADPSRDPNWRTLEEYDRARLTRAIIDDYERGVIPHGLLDQYSRDGQEVTLASGERLLVHDLIENQRRACYELLKRRLDTRAIAAMLMRSEEWVESIRQEFKLF